MDLFPFVGNQRPDGTRRRSTRCSDCRRLYQAEGRLRRRREREAGVIQEPRELLPAAPLSMAVERWLSREIALGGERPALVACLGADDRTLWDWREGKRRSVELPLADRILTALDVLWFDVWDPEVFPDVVRFWEGSPVLI